MKEIDFLPERFRRSASRPRWRRHTFVIVGLVLLALACIHALHELRAGLAAASPAIPHDGADLPAANDAAHRIRWNLPPDRRTQVPAIDFVTQSLAGIETESFLIEGLNIRSDTTVIEIPFHPEPRAAGTGGGARPSLVSLLGEEPLQAEVIGYSGSEIEIGMLLGRLTASPYTDGARLTKTGRTRIDSQTMHEFRIAFALRRQGAAERTATADKSGGDGDLSQP